MIKLTSAWRIEQQFGVLVHHDCEARYLRNQLSELIRDQQQIHHKFSLVVAQSHVAAQVRLCVCKEQEVRVRGPLLDPDPHREQEDNVVVGHKFKLNV